MDESVLISVIVPIYKVEKYIQRCVDSILNQTYRNLEIILVDDGSPDGCPEICDEYANQDKRVVVIHQKNQGLSAARNSGLDYATGEYYVFVDSDDFVTETFVETLYKTIIQNNTKLAICNHICVDEVGRPVAVKNDTYVINEIISERDINQRLMKYTTHMCVVAWNKIYHRSLWEHVRYPKGKVCEDEYIFCDIVSQCKKIACSASHNYCYRIRNDSITKNMNYKYYNDMITASKRRIDYYQIKGWTDLEKRGYVWMLDEVMMCYLYCLAPSEKLWYRNVLRDINQYIKIHNMFKQMSFKEKIKLFGCNYFPWLINQLGLLFLKLREYKSSCT